MIFDIKDFGSIKAMHSYISKNSDAIVSAKKEIIKHADSCSFYQTGYYDNEKVAKYDKPIEKNASNDLEILPVKVIINTTNVYDSHGDVHVKGLWDDDINQATEHLREHKSGLDNVISSDSDLKAYVQDFNFKDIGFKKYKGSTQALVFESDVRKIRNEFMFNQYANGWIKQHSVGMRYKEVYTAIDDKDYPLEYANYKKYIDLVANKDDIKDSYFFAVTKAVPLEGSAVKRGSNPITPDITNQKNILPLITESKKIKKHFFV